MTSVPASAARFEQNPGFSARWSGCMLLANRQCFVALQRRCLVAAVRRVRESDLTMSHLSSRRL